MSNCPSNCSLSSFLYHLLLHSCLFGTAFARKIRAVKTLTWKEKLDALTWEYNKSPLEQIKERLTTGDWAGEKQLFKLLVVLLPISLYLLTTLLDITGMGSTNFLSSGSSALGYILEILFVYIATFLMGIHLVHTSKVSYKGRFMGEKLREQAFSSLTTVGTPISILSILLFIMKAVQQGSPASIFVTIFFFGYFIMAAVIFILFLAIFEPISILILIKIINWWKRPRQDVLAISGQTGNNMIAGKSWWKNHRQSPQKMDWQKLLIAFCFGLIGTLITIGIFYIFVNAIIPAFYPATGENPIDYYMQNFGPTGKPNLTAEIITEAATFVDTLQVASFIFTLVLILVISMKFVQNSSVSIFPYLFGVIVFTIIWGLMLTAGLLFYSWEFYPT